MSDSGEKPRIITGDEWKQPQQDAGQQGGEASAEGADAEKKLHIDDDWKAQARAEKERLAREADEPAAEGGQEADAAGGRGMPPANFQTLMSTLASQALLYMGAIPDPSTGQRIAHLELAKHHIDLIGVLQEKTEGNLEDEEKQMIDQTVHELRMYYTQVSDQLAKQQAQQGQGGGGEAGGMGGMGGAGPLGGGGGNPLGGQGPLG